MKCEKWVVNIHTHTHQIHYNNVNGRIITDHNDDKDNDDEEEENVTDEEDHLEAEDEAEGEGDAAEDERGERQDESAQSRTVG